jgi:hypothetical protein
MGRAALAFRLHMRQHVKIQFGIVIELALTRWQILVERRLDEIVVGQQSREVLRDIVQRKWERLALQAGARIGAEVFQFICHGNNSFYQDQD